MIFHVLTIFPEFFTGPFEYGVVKRGCDAGLLEIRIHNLREWTFDRHKTVDDRPFGGGEGMVLKAEPVFLAVESIWPERTAAQKVLLLSAQGKLFDQSVANRLSGGPGGAVGVVRTGRRTIAAAGDATARSRSAATSAKTRRRIPVRLTGRGRPAGIRRAGRRRGRSPG